MNTIEKMKIAIESFSELKRNWDTYDADEITIQSIITAHKVLDALPKMIDINTVNVCPMRHGGVQIDVGDSKEIEVFNETVREISYDFNNKISHIYSYSL